MPKKMKSKSSKRKKPILDQSENKINIFFNIQKGQILGNPSKSKQAFHHLFWEFKKKLNYTTICDHPRSKYVVVNPRYTTSRVKSCTVNIWYRTCRICNFMRHVVVFRRETVVLQVSKNTSKEVFFNLTSKENKRLISHQKWQKNSAFLQQM